MRIIDPLVTHLSPHLGAPTHPSTLEMLWTKEHIPIPSSFDVFTFRLTFESYKGFGDVSFNLAEHRPKYWLWTSETNIYIRSIVALMFVLDGQKVIHPLHLLSILKLKKVRNKKKQLVWGDGDGCYLCRNPTLAKCGGEAQHLEKVRSWSPPGLPNV